MNTKLELGRIAGIPIVLDMLFVLILILFSTQYFTSGNVQTMSIGVVVVAGILGSILLHELGHAFAARWWGVGSSLIEIGGLGGLVHFTRSLPASVIARTVVYLAGPLANLLLWLGLDYLGRLSLNQGQFGLTSALFALSRINLAFLIFNLLPAFPLDGGRTLDVWIGAVFGYAWGIRVVGCLGVLVSLAIGFYALPGDFVSPGNLWMMLLAIILFAENLQQLQRVGWPRGWR